jgi:AcrR family transcriptional regulator
MEGTVDCLLDATERVLADVGWHALSTNRVAKVAGVSVGTLYHYFPNREAMARGLVHRP